ncbi:lamin tail domain-containing protein [Fontisphaera persica]|uniref:lamin tail domain-containing protein n=1 Tax=Fontisphaera persica TaxID=2974023 RepID=UPI0024C0453A|nr:lamin tail domain-containing protein [Fontisphaera persica]WCJ60368.1 lamin tail domain-containing protein [Fontisphaera persica]
MRAAGGLYFNGIDTYVDFGAALPSLGLSNFTLEVWFRWDGGGQAASSGSGGVSAIPLIAKGRGEADGDNRDCNYFFGIQPDQRVLAADFENYSNGGNNPILGVTTITTGVWHHAAVTYDGTQWALYLNGRLERTLAAGQVPRYDSIQWASLGSALTSAGVPSGYFQGVLDEARIWNYARPAATISNEMTLTISTAPGLAGRWALDDGAGNVAQDSSGNSLIGQIRGAVVWSDGYPFVEPATAWVAYNDHYPGPTTHSNATAWNVFDTFNGAPGNRGNLKNIETGANTPVVLTITNLNVSPGTAAGAPLPGTPAYEVFNGFVDFGSADNYHSILLAPNAVVAHVFTGLNPQRRYNFHGTAVRGNSSYTTRYSLFELSGANSFTPAHTSNALTSAHLPGQLGANQVAINTGFNTSGDMCVWLNIDPGPDGSITIFSRKYTGALPGGQQADTVNSSYALTAIRLEEVGAGLTVAITNPVDGAEFEAPLHLRIDASVSGRATNVVFFVNNWRLGEDAAAPYSLTWSNAITGTNALWVVASDTRGNAYTSSVVSVVVRPQPTNAVPPAIAQIMPPPGASLGSLSNVTVTFTEPVIRVDAGDLLANQTPALSVVGGPTQYTFTFAPMPPGTVNLEWAVNHEIRDVGTPTYAFNGQPTWSYTLMDVTPPVIVSRTPVPGAWATNLISATVLFSEVVNGVDVSDLLVNGQPAFRLTGGGTTYTFWFEMPPVLTLAQLTWAEGHGITDLGGNPLAASSVTEPWGIVHGLPLEELVASNAVYRFFRGYTEASTPIQAWRSLNFDDSSWESGPAPFYYENQPGSATAYTGNTALLDMYGAYTCVFLRRVFQVPNPSVVAMAFARGRADDGYVLYLNGVDIGRHNMPAGDLSITTRPSGGAVAEPPTNNYFVISSNLILAGSNVLAVQAFNDQVTSSDFLIDLELVGYINNPATQPPRIISLTPPPGEVFELTNLWVRFSRPVTGLIAGDLLINGVPASGVRGSNDIYEFSFARPAFGPVVVTWRTTHQIRDFATPPNPMIPAVAYNYSLVNPNAPIIVNQTPPAGATVDNELTRVEVLFSRPVTGVDAADLLVNGVPASGVTGSGDRYVFTFASPAYGTVGIGWATNHGIRSADNPADTFDGLRAGNRWQYTLVDRLPPVIVSLTPPAGATVSNLTQVTIQFSEPVQGVDAGDLLVNGVGAASVTGTGAVFTFTFAPQNGTLLQFTWLATHGIRDLAVPPNAFNANAPGATWNYYSVDQTPPVVAHVSPFSGATLCDLSTVEVTFSEPVQGVTPDDLRLNGVPAVTVRGAGTGPYRFSFNPPPAGPVAVTWSSNHGIADMANPSNRFGGQGWNYQYQPQVSFEGQVVINEIMYHPGSENSAEEFIEIYNATSQAISLAGWRFTRGVDFVFTNEVLPARGYLVVAADLNAFRAKYPGITNVAGDWTGRLSNNGEEILLRDACGNVVDSVIYSPDGEWGIRQRGPNDQGYYGWEWFAAHDGWKVNTYTGQTEGNRSLELVNPALPRQFGQNWQASQLQGGTPGAPNSVARTNTAPVITGVRHDPAVPKPADSVVVLARVADEQPQTMQVIVYYRDHTTTSPGAWNAALMYDDGLHRDGAAGDGLFATDLPPQPNGTIIEYYVQALDDLYQIRTWPAPARQLSGSTPEFAQTANALYQVDDNLAPAGTAQAEQPFLRLIMTGSERQEFANLSANAYNSDAEMNATFITWDAGGWEVRHNVGVRIRGAGSRSRPVKNWRVNLPADRRWKGLTEINLNAQHIDLQLIGSVLSSLVELPAAQGYPVQVRLNGVNLARSAPPDTSRSDGYGTYLLLTPLNGEWAENLLPHNSGGNVYRGSRYPWTANLDYRGTNYQTYINLGYSKASNTSENDWTDLFALTAALNNATPDDALYAVGVRSNANVQIFMRYFALCNFVNYNESSMCNGVGDDYAMYRGVADPRFILLPHDYDTILGLGDNDRMPDPTVSIWRMVDSPRSTDPSMRANYLQRFMRHPEFAAIYLREQQSLVDGVMRPEIFNTLVRQWLGGWADPGRIAQMTNFVAQRRAYVQSQIPTNNTLNISLSTSQGYYYTSSANVTLNGLANSLRVTSVRINGNPASYTVWNGQWSGTTTLSPGLNQVTVQWLDANQGEVLRTNVMVWYDNGTTRNVSGTLAANTLWSAAQGPYRVTSDVTVPEGLTLTIQPGTTVYFDSGARLIVNGRILAEGTDYQRIIFTRQPGSSATWGGIRINGNAASPECRLAYAHFEHYGTAAITANGATVLLDHLTFGTTNQRYLNLDNGCSFVVSYCVFPAPSAAIEPVHGTGGIKPGGRGLFYRNYFGAVNGYNDTVDFTGGNRPGPILEFIENVFMGSGDDLLDLDGTDAHVEGNIFLHTHRNGSPDTASAISGGRDGANTSEITIVRNIFYDCDHVALAKEGNYYWLQNNTVVRLTRQGGVDTASAVICMADEGTAEGAGAYLEGNIIQEVEALVRNQTSSVVVYTNNLLPLPWSGPGGSNLVAAPSFKRIPNLSETYFASWEQAQMMWDWFSLAADSPARGRGVFGMDLGARIPAGPVLQPLPAEVGQRDLNIGVAGAGLSGYRYRLDGDNFTANIFPMDQPIALRNLLDGLHTLEVMAQDSAGIWRTQQIASLNFTVNLAAVPVVLSEILSANRQAFVWHGSTPDVIELYNPSPAPVNLGGCRLTDDPANPDKYTFPAGTTIPAGGYLLVFADDRFNVPGLHTGFALDQNGEGVYLFDAHSRGGRLLDAVEFGFQIPDLSIARLPDGQWNLAQPTLGLANRGVILGDAMALRVNEWMARPLQGPDFIEIYNPTPLPVALGGLYLTDNLVGWPDRHRIRPLSFIAPYGFAVYEADSQVAAGPWHLNFSLSGEQGMVALVNQQLQVIDAVAYGPQLVGQSQGRSPNGAANIIRLSTATPGSGNPLDIAPQIQTLTLVNFTNFWRYEESGTDLGTAWREVGYDDSSWPTGRALLAGATTGTLPEYGGVPVNTPLSIVTDKRTFYFRTTFVLPTNVMVTGLQIRHVLDDGAVFYVNGQEVTRYNMPTGEINYLTFSASSISTASLLGPSEFPMTGLRPGTNVLAVEVHQSSSTSSDLVMGMELVALLQTNQAGGPALVLNEVMADNLSYTNRDGSVTDWIELRNLSAQTMDLSGMSLTDDPANPQRWVFPPGVSLPPLGYLVVLCDNNRPASTNADLILNTGFGLSAAGDGVYLYDRPQNGGALLQSVVFGLQAMDFALGRVPDGSGVWQLTLPTPGSANIPAVLGSPTSLRINEWMPRPASGDDWFEIYNAGAQPVELSGMYLTDNLGNPTKHPLPPLSFIGAQASGYRVLYADNNTSAGANHVNFRLDNTREAIGLAGTNGVLLDAITYEYPESGVSEGRFPDGASVTVRFSDSASPGDANYRRLTNVVISEVLANSNENFEDAIELQNISGEPVDISGWWLSDSRNHLMKFRIPNGTVLPPGGFAVFYEYQFNANPDDESSFAVSSWGEDIYLSAGNSNGLTGWRTSVDFGPSAANSSMARYILSTGEKEFVSASARTFGRDNPASVQEFRQGNGASNAPPLVGPLAITQIMFQPPLLGTNDNTRDEYIEIRNITTQSQPLFDPLRPTNTWRLRNGVDFDFPAVTLPPQGVLLVVGFDPINDPQTLAAFRAVYNLGPGVVVLGPWSGKLANDGETIELKRPGEPDTNGVPYYMVERIRYSDRAPWPLIPAGSGLALHRLNFTGYGNEPTNWMAAAPAPAYLPLTDTDGDGLPDEWERRFGLNPENPIDALQDVDGDGMTNLQEYLAGTNPNDRASVLRLEQPARDEASGGFVLQFTAVAERSYTIQQRNSLGQGSWQKYMDIAPAATNRPVRVILPNGGGQQYYRLITPMQP